MSASIGPSTPSDPRLHLGDLTVEEDGYGNPVAGDVQAEVSAPLPDSEYEVSETQQEPEIEVHEEHVKGGGNDFTFDGTSNWR